jgi:bifunctional non-homologous end joining protein LigD
MLSRCSPVAGLEFINPCLPCVTMLPPSGDGWLHEIKHPGRRLIARRAGEVVRLFAECGADWTPRFPILVESMLTLPVKSCVIDGDLACCDEHGHARIDAFADDQPATGASLSAFDLLEVNGFDLRADPVETRKRALTCLLRKPPLAIRFNEWFDHCGEPMRRQIGRMGFDGIISKRRGSRYLSGRSPDWLLSKNLDWTRLPLPDCGNPQFPEANIDHLSIGNRTG